MRSRKPLLMVFGLLVSFIAILFIKTVVASTIVVVVVVIIKAVILIVFVVYIEGFGRFLRFMG